MYLSGSQTNPNDWYYLRAKFLIYLPAGEFTLTFLLTCLGNLIFFYETILLGLCRPEKVVGLWPCPELLFVSNLVDVYLEASYETARLKPFRFPWSICLVEFGCLSLGGLCRIDLTGDSIKGWTAFVLTLAVIACSIYCMSNLFSGFYPFERHCPSSELLILRLKNILGEISCWESFSSTIDKDSLQLLLLLMSSSQSKTTTDSSFLVWVFSISVFEFVDFWALNYFSLSWRV